MNLRKRNLHAAVRAPWAILAGAMLVLLWPAALHAAVITITKVQDLNFGYCDATPSATYTVLPAASPGGGACQGASAARFDITGDPTRRAKITLSNTVTITNGTESLTVSLSDSAGAQNICLGTGAITMYVGGSVTIPAGGMVSTGLLTISTTLKLAYIGGSC